MSKMTALAPAALLAAASPCLGQAQAYLVDSDLDMLFTVDVASGAATPVAPTANNGLGTPADLVWRGDTQELWTIDLGGGEVGTIDVATGAFTPIHLTGLDGWQGMAWDPITQLYYLANQNGSTYALDPVSGVTTLLGPTGFSLVTCLEVDATGTLYGINFSSQTSIVRIDKVTGAGTAVATTIAGFQGLGIDATTGFWYGANSNDDALYAIDPSSGVATLIGAHGAGVTFAKGFDLAGGAAGLGTRYCTPGVANSTGTAAGISATGSPFVNDGDVTLHVTELPPDAFAYILASRNQGFVAQPGGSQGNLCLGGAIGRFVGPGQIQSSGAGGSIDLAIDLQLHPTPGGLMPVVAGETWHYQCWYRDAIGSVPTSNFSDGLAIPYQ